MLSAEVDSVSFRKITTGDVQPDMGDFHERMAAKMKKIEEDQVRQATALVNDAVAQERAAQRAEEKIAASKQRFEKFKKEQAV